MNEQINTMWKACTIAFFAMVLTLLSPEVLVFAQNTPAGDSNITNILCNAINQLTGNVGKAIAILIIISLAISLFLGKVSWGMAIAVAVGMGILFGAKGVVGLLSGDTGAICT